MTNDSSPQTEQAVRRIGAYVAAAFAGAVFGLVGVWAAVFWWGPEALPPVTSATLQSAQQAWQGNAPANYDLEVTVSGRESAKFAVMVREGAVREARRNGELLRQQRTWNTWSVPGMFETIERDLESMSRQREGKAEPGMPTLILRGTFAPQSGMPLRYQRTEVYKFAANQEVMWEVTRFEIVSDTAQQNEAASSSTPK